LTFPFDFLSFRLIDIGKGETVNVVLTFSENVPTYAEYWKYGKTSDNQTDHWYRFPFGSNDGDNIITLTITDGEDGDNDLLANGEIIDPSGPGFPASESYGGSGDDNPCFIESVLGVAKASEGIMVVRRFRDENLLANPVGQVLVGTYYKVSPPLAEFIRNHSVLRSIAREMLKPLIWMSKEIVE